jgi:outer membrane protein TolC
MMIRTPLIALMLCAGSSALVAQSREAPSPRLVTLREALELALEHNHRVQMARSSVEAKQEAKAVARSAYYPSVRNESSFAHLTDTQFIGIPAGSLGVVGRNLIPPGDLTISQGALDLTTVGTGLVQPLTPLLKIKAANDVARADVEATRGKARGTENSIALKVHQIYYQILIAEVRRRAVEAKIQASDDLQTERVQQVRYGSALDADLIESRAQALQARQELVTTELQLSDLHMQFNDIVGLPLTTAVRLDPDVTTAPAETCAGEECVQLALESHPEIAEARAEVDRAASSVRLAKYQFIPDVDAFARYSYQKNVPFLANHFGTFGVSLTYELFDGGRRRAAVRERHAQLTEAEENLARISDEIQLRVQTAANKLERTRQMIAVSSELLALRSESRRMAAERLTRGASLQSQASGSEAQELEAKAVLLQSQLDFLQAADELTEAIGRRPQ